MTSGDQGAARAIRLWWALPIGLAVVTAVVLVAVVLPALAGGPQVPTRLVVHRSPAPAATTPSVTGTPQPVRSTTVVGPEHPVIRETDESHDDHGGRGSGDVGDR